MTAVQGQVTYNGYTFDGATSMAVEVEMVYDDSGQVVTHHRNLLTVNAIVQNDSGTDASMENLKRKLGAAGGNLIFRGKGFGTSLNVLGTDIEGGPFPRTISWDPIAGKNAAEVVWQVESNVPVCVGESQTFGIRAINYGITYEIDIHGMTVRTYEGYIQVANSRRRPSSADQFRERFAPPTIPGYQRSQSWRLSTDKTRVDFVITDTQIPSANPYPERVTNISGSHRVSWDQKSAKFFSSYDMDITLAPSENGTLAWSIFRTLLAQKLKRLVSAGEHPFLMSLSVEENVFGADSSFSAKYWHLEERKESTGNNRAVIADFVRNPGLWEPIGTTWPKHDLSLRDVHSHRGVSELGDLPTDNVIPTLCGTGSSAVVKPNNVHKRFSDRVRTPPTLTNAMPESARSFIRSDNEMIIETDRNLVRQQVLQSPVSDSKQWDLLGLVAPSRSYQTAPSTGGVVEDVLQESGKPAYTITMVGGALRAGHEIPRPTIDRVGNSKVDELNSKFQTSCIGGFFGVPVYKAIWVLRYLVPGIPGTVLPSVKY